MDRASPKEDKKLFKDWFDEQAAKLLAAQFSTVWPSFPTKKFIKLASNDLASLEFSGRINQFANALAQCLPDDMPQSLAIIRSSLPPPLPNCDAVTDGWLQWPIGQFIADRGLGFFEESMLTMVELTQRFSSEFAVRPFVEHKQQETIHYFSTLTEHESPHVRRWCSEGLRTRLPWGRKLNNLITNPRPVLPILEALKDDEERYVRRSVANNLNDISKDHPSIVIARCKNWYQESKQERIATVKQALRGLIKAGNLEALAVIGFGPPHKLQATLKVSQTQIAIGEAVTLVAELESSASQSQPVLVDYVVHFVRQNGKSTAKVFKWKTVTLQNRATHQITKKHSFKTTTVRALYPGRHFIELQINGVRVASTAVVLKP